MRGEYAMAKDLPKCGACNINPGIYVQELESGEKIMICDECQYRDVEANRKLFWKQKTEQGYEPEGLTKLDVICFDCGRKITFSTEGNYYIVFFDST